MTSTAVPRSTARLRRIDLRVVIGLALLLAGVVARWRWSSGPGNGCRYW
jgi:hypothetical protein